MKKLLLGLFLSTTAFPHGWIEFKMARFFERGKLGPVMAIGMREPIVFGLNYLNWNGAGVDVREAVWLTSNHDLEVELTDSISVSAGVSLRHNDVNYSDCHGTVKIGLWE